MNFIATRLFLLAFKEKCSKNTTFSISRQSDLYPATKWILPLFSKSNQPCRKAYLTTDIGYTGKGPNSDKKRPKANWCPFLSFFSLPSAVLGGEAKVGIPLFFRVNVLFLSNKFSWDDVTELCLDLGMVRPVFPPCKLPEVRLRLLLEDELLISPACSILWEENAEISKFLKSRK